MKSIKCTLAISTAALLLASSTAFAISKLDPPAGDFGMYGRVININANTRWINVDQGETIRLLNQSTGQITILTFDGGDKPVLDLRTVVPDLQ